MRIGFNARFLYDPHLRGLNRYTFSLLRALDSLQAVAITLFTESRFPVHAKYAERLRADINTAQARRTLVWEQWTLPRILKHGLVDIFHAPADGGLPFLKTCPKVLTLHGVPDESLAQQLRSGALNGKLDEYLDLGLPKPLIGRSIRGIRSRTLRSLYIRAADIVITVSEFSKNELVQHLRINPEKIRVIYEAADEEFLVTRNPESLDQLRAKYGIPRQFILFVGGFDRRKNVLALLRAYSALRTLEPDVALVLVGIGGDLEGCRRESVVLGLREGESVFYLTGIPDVELASLYQAASVFTTLSWHEGFCLPLVEAMACGSPILASKAGAIPEILGAAGWLVDAHHQDEIVEALRVIIRDEDVRADLRRRSVARSDAFSWRVAALQTLSVYEELRSKCG